MGMEMERMYSNLTKGIRKQYILVLTLIGFLAIAGTVLLETVIKSQEKGAEIINIAGRQRMLSQRISLHASQLVTLGVESDRQEALKKIKQATNLLKQSHAQLTDAEILDKAPLSLKEIYFSEPANIDQDVQIFINHIDRLITLVEKNKPVNFTTINVIANHSDRLLKNFDKVVSIHQTDTENKTKQISTFQTINLGLILLVLFLSGHFVFRRIVTNLQNRIDDLAEAEERFRSITHFAEISVIVASAKEGTILSWNPAAERSFGYSNKDVLGKPLTMIMPERFRERHNKDLKQAFETDDYKQMGKTVELKALHKDGHEFPIELSLGSWQSKGQKYFSAIIHDISERKASEKEQETLKKHLFTAIESMSEGFALFDDQDKLLIHNSVFSQMYSKHKHAIKNGETLENILRAGIKAGSFPQAKGNEEEWIAERLHIHQNPQGPIEQELDDGRWLLISERKTKDGGTVGVRTDITEKRKSDAELRKLKMAIEQSLSGILITDANGIIEYTNPRFEQISGYSNEEIIGYKPSMFSSGLEPSNKFDELWTVISSGKVWQGTLQNKKKDGTIFVEDTIISPVRDDNGIIQNYLAIKEDITEKLRIEDSLKRSQKLEAVGQLAGGLAHDFNNLLAIIGGNLELLQRYVKDNEKAAKKVETALKAANRGGKLTKQLLGFTRQSPTKLDTVSVNQLIEDVTPLIEHSLSRSIELELSLADDIYPVDIDSGDFEDCLVNLAVNAKHAMPHSGKLIIETKNVEMNFETEGDSQETSPYVRISVSDSGKGIPEEIQSKIFEPFFTTKDKTKGTGLGLSMVFGFVRRSEGQIKLYSEIDVGTTFKIFLPQSQNQEITVKTNTIDTKEDLSGTEKILIVDDETELLKIAESYLREAGYTVYSASNPKDALILLKHQKDFDLLFSDVVMPGEINGFDLAFETIRISPKTKIQLTSGFTAQAGKRLIKGNIYAKQLYSKLLTKPYNRSMLLQAIRQTLDTKTLIDWSPDFNTGIDLIDKDHQVLLALLNRLYQSLNNDDSLETQDLIIQELADYTFYHFDNEEAIMEACDYPHLKNHQQVHTLLKRYASEKIDSLKNKTDKAQSEDLLQFLKNWLLDHILGMDKDITPFAKGKEEKIEETLNALNKKREKEANDY